MSISKEAATIRKLYEDLKFVHLQEPPAVQRDVLRLLDAYEEERRKKWATFAGGSIALAAFFCIVIWPPSARTPVANVDLHITEGRASDGSAVRYIQHIPTGACGVQVGGVAWSVGPEVCSFERTRETKP